MKTILTMNYWQGEKIRLRGLELSDVDFFYNWNLETETQRNLAWIWFPSTRESQLEWIKKESLNKGESDEYFLVIEDLNGDQVGSISTNTINKIDGTFRYGIAIVDSARRMGYASEAIKILLTYFFNELRYNKVNVVIYEYNKSSILLHENLGFQKEGQLRQTKFTDGKYWDTLIYGMIKEEFNKSFS